MIYVILLRFAEIFGICGIFSAILSILSLTCNSFLNGLIPLLLAIFAIMFVIANIMQLRRCYFEVKGGMDYYISNFTAYAIFAVATAAVYLLFGDTTYTWLFAITKVISFFGDRVSIVASTALFHFVMCMIIILAPIGLRQKYAWRFD